MEIPRPRCELPPAPLQVAPAIADNTIRPSIRSLGVGDGHVLLPPAYVPPSNPPPSPLRSTPSANQPSCRFPPALQGPTLTAPRSVRPIPRPATTRQNKSSPLRTPAAVPLDTLSTRPANPRFDTLPATRPKRFSPHRLA